MQRTRKTCGKGKNETGVRSERPDALSCCGYAGGREEMPGDEMGREEVFGGEAGRGEVFGGELGGQELKEEEN